MSFGCSLDYDECDPRFNEHSKDCPPHSYCSDSYGSYSCECLSGYEKHSNENICVAEGMYCTMKYAKSVHNILNQVCAVAL